MFLYIESRELDLMPSIRPFLWAIAVVTVALLNIADVLPDWATIAAILTLPFMATLSGMHCRPAKGIDQ
ncbi:hypothetical protein [Pelagerythrobacter marinus]|jgi:hypothetical protein|uniref:Uncharacterized protein n=1 Tax=Pelagerythrobacter marinus TaxID=538382 RepID=A0ABW9UYW8_9SPHN|nr:hypothetical protein [Pelagerythrobacter marinus]MXO68985.1 hypothetical protein [Pelagerythrobacter marinus]USA39280.1 hypothetical protein NCF86_13465 [Pelagerythrobacter marinus]WPZ06632.1 hypothetical protein T8T98_14640 [Pelagerythrobacter marinus]